MYKMTKGNNMNKKIKGQYRQGDVLVTPTNKNPVGKKHKKENDRVILARGEATGHHHSFSGGGVELLDAPTGETILVVKKKNKLEHQEHGAIVHEPCVKEVLSQRQYNYFTDEVQRVTD